MTEPWQLTLVGLAMVTSFVLMWWRKVPHVISLSVAAAVGTLVAGLGVPVRSLIEGSFLFFDLTLVIFTATVFVGALRSTGALAGLISDIVGAFRGRPFFLLSVMTLVVMLPGMLTGSGTAAVLSVGALVGTVLVHIGIPLVTATTIIAVGGIAGSIAPPVNIPAMAMANGINMPYVGLDGPLALIAFPIGLISAWWLGARHLKRNVDVDALTLQLEREAPVRRPGRLATYFPLSAVLVGMSLSRLFPDSGFEPGVPLIFVVGTMLTFALARNTNVVRSVTASVDEAMTVASILIGVGAFVEVMTLTGVRGLFVITAVTLPDIGLLVFTFFGFAIIGSLLGSYGSGTAFGIPVTLAFLDRDPILAIAGLSVLAGFSSLTPPTAIVGQAAQIVMKFRGKYVDVLRHAAVPWIAASVVGILVVAFANRLGGRLPY